jgi:hypothetical protein
MQVDPLPPDFELVSPANPTTTENTIADGSPSQFVTPKKNRMISTTDTGTMDLTLPSVLQTPAELLKKGRPHVHKPHRNPQGQRELQNSVEWQDKRKEEITRQQIKDASACYAQKVAEREVVMKQKKEEIDRAHLVFQNITTLQDEGGFGFANMKHFLECLFGTGSDPQIKANITRFCQDSGTDFAAQIFDRSPQALDQFLEGPFSDKIHKEGEGIQKLLTQPLGTKMNELLDKFSVEKTGETLQETAPLLWSVLTSSVSSSEGSSRKSKELVCSPMYCLYT